MRTIRITLLAAVLLLGALLSGCGAVATAEPRGLVAGDDLAPIDAATVDGMITVTGSSTVYPLTAEVANDFAEEGARVQIDVRRTGTGGGFRSFCNGDDVQIVNASRPITAEEQAACTAAGRVPVGFAVGMDALAVVVNSQNTWVEALTFAQLRAIFSGQARSWADVDPSYPAAPIAVYSPGVDSGTFDYFVERVFDGDDEPLQQVPGAVLSEDDVELRTGIEANPNAIGYFGYAYYQGAQGRLRAIAIDGGQGAVAPSADTVQNGSYPFARPLYIYTSEQLLHERPEVAAFVSYYLQHVDSVIEAVGYFPSAEETRLEARRALVDAVQ